MAGSCWMSACLPLRSSWSSSSSSCPHHRPISCHLFVSSCLLWLDVVEMHLYFWISSLSCLFSKLLPNHPSKSESLRDVSHLCFSIGPKSPGDQPIRRHSFLFPALTAGTSRRSETPTMMASSMRARWRILRQALRFWTRLRWLQDYW